MKPYKILTLKFNSMKNNSLKVGDTVLVDVDFQNGGYEAEIVSLGHIYASIKVDGREREILKDRLTLKK